MSRLIDADELKYGLFHLEGETSLTDRQLGYQAGWNDALMYGVLDAPTVEAEPVKHGHWKYDNQYHWYRACCSECGYYRVTDIKADRWNEWKYCPNCGAKMDAIDAIISNVSTVDAEEVVRCKDCIHKPRGTRNKHDMEFPDDICPCQCEDYWYSWMPYDDWFCANGERREDEVN